MKMVRSFYLEDHHGYQENQIQKALDDILSRKDAALVFLIESDNETAGYFILSFGWSLEYFGRDVWIDELYVREKFRRLGLGKRSLEFIELYVKEKKFKAIHLEVNKFSIARKLYESKGYISHNSDLMSKRF
jgi:diamine N-acetyltransferase